jgi:hypothetical protein
MTVVREGMSPAGASTSEVLEEAFLVEVLGKEELACRSRKAFLRMGGVVVKSRDGKESTAMCVEMSGSGGETEGVWLTVPTVMVFYLL